MGYKINLTLEVFSKQQRDDLLRDIRGLLLQQPISIKGKLKQSIETEAIGGDYLSLIDFGVEQLPLTPVEQTIKDIHEDDIITPAQRTPYLLVQGDGFDEEDVETLTDNLPDDKHSSITDDDTTE